jgi:hypothetical protein
MPIRIGNPDLDRHQNGNLDPNRHQNDADPKHCLRQSLSASVPSKAVFRIRIHLMRIRIQGSDDQKFKKIYSMKKEKFWIKNSNLPIPRPPEKEVQATEETFSPQKRTSRTSKHKIS